MATKITLPEMGEGVIEGTLSRWLVREGDRIEQYAPIAEVETDKVTTETTSDVAGVVLKLVVSEGQVVPVGGVLAYVGQPGEALESGEGQPAAATPQSSVPVATALTTTPSPSPEPPAEMYLGRISPVVGRIAAEHKVDLNRVVGTGRDGRITKEDVLDYLKAREATATQPQLTEEATPASAPAQATSIVPEQPRISPAQAPAAPTSTATPGDLLPLTTMRRSIAEHMVLSKHTSPHVTTVFEIDFSAVSAHRKAHKDSFARDGANLTFTAYIIAATVEALKRHPLVNSSWSDAGIVLKREINIGMATALDEGLIVPVIKNADSLNLLGLARQINDLAARARSRQLKPGEVQGGTFSITNHGTSGSLFATPIINQPQCGILGVGMIEKRVKVIDDAIAIRPLAYVSFTFDHRILDGASADAFVGTIKAIIEGWR